MTIKAFEKEIKKVSKHFSIAKNIKMTEYATVFLFDEPLFGIPAEKIYDEIKPDYGVVLPTGNFHRYRTRPEALAMIKGIFERYSTDPDYADALLGKGEYTDSKLKIKA